MHWAVGTYSRYLQSSYCCCDVWLAERSSWR